jgi:hypothetical protein
MDFVQVADNFPAWDVVDSDGTNIGVATNFSGEGFVVTIKADFTWDKPRTLAEPTVKSLDAFRSITATWLLTLKGTWDLTGGEIEYVFESGGEA